MKTKLYRNTTFGRNIEESKKELTLRNLDKFFLKYIHIKCLRFIFVNSCKKCTRKKYSFDNAE